MNALGHSTHVNAALPHTAIGVQMSAHVEYATSAIHSSSSLPIDHLAYQRGA